MPRPCKSRRVRGVANSHFFKPSGIPKRELAVVVLEMDEFEAMRLVDLLEVGQENAADRMDVSQPTLSRILRTARKKLADAIVNGKAIEIVNL